MEYDKKRKNEKDAYKLTQNGNGKLIIAGGALSDDNLDVYNRFIKLSGGIKNAKIGIFPAASNKPVFYSQMIIQVFENMGVDSKNISIIPLALNSDPTTKNNDESLWHKNINDINVSEQINACTGIWIIGGDQVNITKLLFDTNKKETLALKALLKMYKNGGIIGGTSAGAAAMSDIMISGGNSIGALKQGIITRYDKEQGQETGGLYVEKGLGMFKHGIIDQHFDRRSRLGRLIVALWNHKEEHPLGYGIDENTAMVYDGKNCEFEVIGTGGVTIVDVREAEKIYKDNVFNLRNIKLSYITQNDQYCLSSGRFTINPIKQKTVGSEYMDIPKPYVTGVFNAYPFLRDFISYKLIDNIASKEAKSFCFDNSGQGFELLFRQTPASEGYWCYINGVVDYYSVLNISLDVTPINVEIHYPFSK